MMHMRIGFVYFLSAILALSACQEKQKLFSLKSPGDTGIHFSNIIKENDTLNILAYEYVYNGGGVAIGDVNQDNLPDIFLSGNQVPNRLYLNQGNFKFKDISEAAGIMAPERWCSGVAMADVNQDGKLDIYVGATVHKPGRNRANLFFVNQGNDADGIPSFAEQAEQFGIADTGQTTHSAFLDYDKDGDLDLYVLTNIINKYPNGFRPKQVKGEDPNTDQLYRNNNDGTFTNVSAEAGIQIEGFGLGVAIHDFNLDGWPDIYVSNDYLSNDLLYINRQDGTFKNEISSAIQHQSYSAMGNDVADINQDGLPDIIALDMLPESNERQKMMLLNNSYSSTFNNDRYGFEFQYVRNTLQVHGGVMSDGSMHFSELAHLTGLHKTDWSWSPLIADYDNDGISDVLITNGFPRDVTDKDFGDYLNSRMVWLKDTMELIDLVPIVKISNYAFQGKGQLAFEDVTEAWGLKRPSFSNGAAFADLDLDGDLDYVVNNIRDSAFVYQNNTESMFPNRNAIRFKLEGKPHANGAIISLERKGNEKMVYHHSPYRGYISSVEPVAHFGLGADSVVEKAYVFWPNGKAQLLENLKAGQVHVLRLEDAKLDMSYKAYLAEEKELLFTEQNEIDYLHKEQDKVDFNIQVTIPHKYTQNGPGLAVGDIDGNGFDDIIIGGSANEVAQFYFQDANGFQPDSMASFEAARRQEDQGLLLFDADQDNDLDLYVVSGSYEFDQSRDSNAYLDRFYRNENGKLVADEKALPPNTDSGIAVRAADFDADGDLDLLVLGRVIPAFYPRPANTRILRNEGGNFVDATQELCPELMKIGLIADGIWTDFDQDGKTDFILAGEWMPLSFFRNTGNGFENSTASSGISDAVGWWNSLQAGDFDQDGDTDYIAGNLGLNTRYVGNAEEPLVMYTADFDSNGSEDAFIACYASSQDGSRGLYPMYTRDDIGKQYVGLRSRIGKHEDFAWREIHEILNEQERARAAYYEANHMVSSYIENLGNGQFSIRTLPQEVQYAPINGMLVQDFNGDSYPDVLMVGNDFGTEVFTGRYDAMSGLLLLGDGKGNFSVQKSAESGFYVPGDAKALALLQRPKQSPLVLATRNRNRLKSFAFDTKLEAVPVPADASHAILSFKDGRRERVEFHYGASYISQSSRVLYVHEDVEEVEVLRFGN